MINPDEKLLAVDKNDRPLDSLPRSEIHQKMLLHRISDIWVVNSQAQVLAQKRSIHKDRWGGMWECWFGGHVLASQTYLECAVTETKEELGLTVSPEDLHLFGKRTVCTKEENIIVSVYGLQTAVDTDNLEIEAEEVELVKWFEADELQKIYQGMDSQWVRYGYELEVLSWLKTQFD
jgi:isopentenyl-diphosphate delta-isomerase